MTLFSMKKHSMTLLASSLVTGEELTIDYSTFMTTAPNFQCWCASAMCRGEIRSDDYKQQWFQERYGSHVTSYISMLIKIQKLEEEISSRKFALNGH